MNIFRKKLANKRLISSSSMHIRLTPGCCRRLYRTIIGGYLDTRDSDQQCWKIYTGQISTGLWRQWLRYFFGTFCTSEEQCPAHLSLYISIHLLPLSVYLHSPLFYPLYFLPFYPYFYIFDTSLFFCVVFLFCPLSIFLLFRGSIFNQITFY